MAPYCCPSPRPPTCSRPSPAVSGQTIAGIPAAFSSKGSSDNLAAGENQRRPPFGSFTSALLIPAADPKPYSDLNGDVDFESTRDPKLLPPDALWHESSDWVAGPWLYGVGKSHGCRRHLGCILLKMARYCGQGSPTPSRGTSRVRWRRSPVPASRISAGGGSGRARACRRGARPTPSSRQRWRRFWPRLQSVPSS